MAQQRRQRWGANTGSASGKSGYNVNMQPANRIGTEGTERGSYYGPPVSGRGRGSGPRNPGHAAAMASNQLPQGNTPLQALTGMRSAGGDVHRNSLGTQDTRAQDTETTTITPRLEMAKTAPTESIEMLLRRLQAKDPTQLTLEDFTTRDSNDGKSILITLLVNFIATLRPELGETQWARIAAHAAIHHPSYLHEAFSDGDVALELTKSFLATRPMKLDIRALCPMDTPYLIVDTDLREYLGQLTRTTSSELRRIIIPFLQCFYPSDWELLEQAIRASTDSTLIDFISTPGALHTYFIREGQRCTFDPPRWLSLSAFQETHADKHANSMPGTNDDDSDDDSIDSEDLLHPLREMRINQEEFDRLDPEIQKTKILAVFPTRMAKVLPADVFGYMIVMLSEMAATSIHGAMDPLTFHRLTGHARKTAIKAAELTPAPQIYHYRFRVQHLGKGYRSWASETPSSILQSWIQAWVPMFAASRCTLALTKHPNDRHLQAISLSAPQDTPTTQALESYVYDVVRTRQGQIHQFDFWILTECPDLNNNGAQSFTRSTTGTAQYQDAIRKAAIWSMKMERTPQGYVPCIFLGNSLLKDDERLIKEEILLRTGFQNESKFEVEWMTISTRSEHAQTMAYCIITKPEDHQLVRTLGTLLVPTDDTRFSITADYQPMVLPIRRGPEEDQELSQAIARHQEYSRALTQVSIKSLPRTSFCYYVPLESGMDGIPPEHDATIAYLVLHGNIKTDEGTTLYSPVTRVNMDSKRTRMFLHAPRGAAGDLITYARGIYRLLAKWYEEDISQASLDTRDAEKLAQNQGRTSDKTQRTGHDTGRDNSTGMTSQHTIYTATTDVGTIPTTQMQPPQQQMVAVPQDQWDRAVQLLVTSAEKMDKMLALLEHMPTVIAHQDALDEAVSVITQSMTLNSDLVNSRADSTIMETRRMLANRVTEVNDHVSRIGNSLGSQHDQVVGSVSQVLHLVGKVMGKMDNTGSTTTTEDSTGGGEHHSEVLAGLQDQDATERMTLAPPSDGVPETVEPQLPPTNTDDMETQATREDVALEAQSIVDVAPTDGEMGSEMADADTAPDDGAKVGSDQGLDESEEDDWEKKYDNESDTDVAKDKDDTPPPSLPLARCHACNKLDENIEVCDYCEIPHHMDCLIKDPNGGPNRYCNECIKLLFGEDQKMPSQSSVNNSDLELSEPDSSSSGDSEVSEFQPSSRRVVKPPAASVSKTQNTASKYSLRDRNKMK